MAYPVMITGGAELAALHPPMEDAPYVPRLAQAVATIPRLTPAESALADLSAQIYLTEFRANQIRHAKQLGNVALTTAKGVAFAVDIANKVVWKLAESKPGRVVLAIGGLAALDEISKIK